jgi:hypothetical protein
VITTLAANGDSDRVIQSSARQGRRRRGLDHRPVMDDHQDRGTSDQPGAKRVRALLDRPPSHGRLARRPRRSSRCRSPAACFRRSSPRRASPSTTCGVAPKSAARTVAPPRVRKVLPLRRDRRRSRPLDSPGPRVCRLGARRADPRRDRFVPRNHALKEPKMSRRMRIALEAGKKAMNKSRSSSRATMVDRPLGNGSRMRTACCMGYSSEVASSALRGSVAHRDRVVRSAQPRRQPAPQRRLRR